MCKKDYSNVFEVNFFFFFQLYSHNWMTVNLKKKNGKIYAASAKVGQT